MVLAKTAIPTIASMQPYAWPSQTCTPYACSSPAAVWDGVPPTLANSEPWVSTGTPDGAEAFQPLHDKDFIASEEDAVEATVKKTAFQLFWVVQPRSAPTWTWSLGIPFDHT